MTQKTPGASSTAQASGKMKPHGDQAPKKKQQPPLPPPPVPWAAEAVPAAQARAAPPSESETSESASTSYGSSSSSSGGSFREYDGAILDAASTSSSSAAIEARRKRRRLYSDTVYPAAGRRKRSSSVDAGTGTEEERNSKFCLYSVLAVVLTVATASIIGMSLRAGDSENDEPREHILPKQATSRAPECRCGSNDTTAEPDAAQGRGSPQTAVNAEAQSTATALAAAGGEADGDTSQPRRPGGVKTVGVNGGLQQQLAGKATRAFIAYKIGPGRRRSGANGPTQTPQEMVPPASLKQDDYPGTQATKTPMKPGDQPARANTTTETQRTTEQTWREHTSPTTPSSKTVTITQPGDATAWELGRPLVGMLRGGQRFRAVRRKTLESLAIRNAARTQRHSSGRSSGDGLATVRR